MKEFYAAIKLKTQEELLCTVVESNPEHDYIVIKNPISLEEMDIPGVIQGIKLSIWMKVSNENLFVIDGDSLLTFKEVTGPVVKFYLANLSKLHLIESSPPRRSKKKRSNKQIDLSRETGYVSSIEEARQSLEDIYNQISKEDS